MSEDVVAAKIPIAEARQMAGAGLMPQPIAEALEHKWVCKNGHILGVTLREKQRKGAKVVTRLLLFRGALMPHHVVPNNIAFAKIDEGEIVCGICGDVKHWYKQKGQ